MRGRGRLMRSGVGTAVVVSGEVGGQTTPGRRSRVSATVAERAPDLGAARGGATRRGRSGWTLGRGGDETRRPSGWRLLHMAGCRLRCRSGTAAEGARRTGGRRRKSGCSGILRGRGSADHASACWSRSYGGEDASRCGSTWCGELVRAEESRSVRCGGAPTQVRCLPLLLSFVVNGMVLTVS
ncbi:uncharacterized protein M6B38_360565 [Iris pallida]|uniref:Uncharacterized protein n=1 Tax=Iris pallida TaxID=29817 RepID=A0AAX6GLM6_IRIPA|nr:uncharacterized protein M6B38_360565 [Iris pallida]